MIYRIQLSRSVVQHFASLQSALEWTLLDYVVLTSAYVAFYSILNFAQLQQRKVEYFVTFS